MRIQAAMISVLAGALLAGCALRTDLVSRRAYYDGYLARADRGRAVAQQDQALLTDLLGQCDAPDEAPYPALQAEVDALLRQAALLQARHAQLLAFERDYDAFSAEQPSVGPKDEAWPRYRQLDGRFQPLGQAVRQAAEAVDAGHARFQTQMGLAGVAKLDPADLRQEIGNFQLDLEKSVDGMEQGLRDWRFRAETAGQAGGDDAWQRRRLDLRAMELAVDDARNFRDLASASSQALSAGLPQEPVYFGPGMPGGAALLGLRQAEQGLMARRHDFAELSHKLDVDRRLDSAPPQDGGVYQGPMGMAQGPAAGRATGAMPVAVQANAGAGPQGQARADATAAAGGISTSPTVAQARPLAAPTPSPVATAVPLNTGPPVQNATPVAAAPPAVAPKAAVPGAPKALPAFTPKAGAPAMLTKTAKPAPGRGKPMPGRKPNAKPKAPPRKDDRMAPTPGAAAGRQ